MGFMTTHKFSSVHVHSPTFTLLIRQTLNEWKDCLPSTGYSHHNDLYYDLSRSYEAKS